MCVPPDCSDEDAARFQMYQVEFESAAEPVLNSSSEDGYFIHSCYIHCQTIENNDAWNVITVNGSTMAQSFGDWYFDRPGSTRLEDCDDFPCNPSCPDPDDAVTTTTPDLSGAVQSTASLYLLAVSVCMLAWLWK